MSNWNDITKWIQRHALTVSTFGHAVMVACAVASYENIHSFFIKLHGSELVAIGLGVAVGAALVMAAGLLSGMAWDWKNPRLQLIAGVTALLALLSGGIQGASYASHGLWWLWAGLLGLALPVVGELGIALAVSAYEQEQKARRAAMADEEVEARINAAVDSAMADIDMSSAKKDVEAAARKIVKRKMDDLLAKRIGPQPTTNLQETGNSNRPTVDELNSERQRQITERRAAIVQLFETFGEMAVGDLQNRLNDDMSINASANTLRGDLAALVDSGDLVKSGRGKWNIAHPIAETLPELAQPVLNGAH